MDSVLEENPIKTKVKANEAKEKRKENKWSSNLTIDVTWLIMRVEACSQLLLESKNKSCIDTKSGYLFDFLNIISAWKFESLTDMRSNGGGF